MNAPIAIVDARAPKEAINTLKERFLVHEFFSERITYDAVSGHPDIFMFQHKDLLVIAPNTPKQTIDFLDTEAIQYSFGNTIVGDSLENTTAYNCIYSGKALFHKKGYTDAHICEILKDKPTQNLSQAYTRCSMLDLKNDLFISSDKGIEKTLVKEGYCSIFVNPEKILLPPYKNGFIGGCLGMHNGELFVLGAFDFVDNGVEIKEEIESKGIIVNELYKGPLYDGGGIFFFENPITNP